MLATATGGFSVGVQVRFFRKSLPYLPARLYDLYQQEDIASAAMVAALQAYRAYQHESVVSEIGGWLALNP